MIVGRHVFTIHEPGAGLNDDNPGSWIRVACFAGGFYLNSYKRQSVWVGVALEWRGVTYSVGLVTGYPDAILHPYFSRGYHSQEWSVLFIPRTRTNSPAVHCSKYKHVSLWTFLRNLFKEPS